MNYLGYIGMKPGDKIKGLHYYWVWFWSAAASYSIIWAATGALWIKTTKAKVCYKKWLGQDWVADYSRRNASTVISNHSTFVDSAVHCLYQLPQFVSKAEVKKVPGLGMNMVYNDCLFIDRQSKESKKSIQQQIVDRHINRSQVTGDPLIIYPEGCTTNGSCLIEFKKGAFVSLQSIKPVLHLFNSWTQSNSTGVLDGMQHYVLSACNPYSTLEVLDLPIFEPNDFFFKHHMKEGEEQWETYMRVIRQIMAEEGGLELSEQSIEDKFKYRALVFGEKNKDKTKSE